MLQTLSVVKYPAPPYIMRNVCTDVVVFLGVCVCVGVCICVCVCVVLRLGVEVGAEVAVEVAGGGGGSHNLPCQSDEGSV